MSIDETLDRIRQRLAVREPRKLSLGGLVPAAVALPLLPDGNDLKVLFTVRASTVEHHKNEISFPGGRVDPHDPDEEAAALRETWEEIGIAPSDLRVLGEMDDFQSISGYRVRPFAVYLDNPCPVFNPHPGEVSEILTIPLGHLLDPRFNKPDPRGEWENRPLHTFCWEDKVVWGLTGAILRHFLSLTFDFTPGTGKNGRS